MGSPVVIVPERYVLARSVVAGRFVNAYCTTDWTLSLNFRARSVSPAALPAAALPATTVHRAALAGPAAAQGGAVMQPPVPNGADYKTLCHEAS